MGTNQASSAAAPVLTRVDFAELESRLMMRGAGRQRLKKAAVLLIGESCLSRALIHGLDYTFGFDPAKPGAERVAIKYRANDRECVDVFPFSLTETQRKVLADIRDWPDVLHTGLSGHILRKKGGNAKD